MKRLYNQVRKRALQHKEASAALDKLIQQRWGFNYSQTDHDRIIDTLDYGTDFLEYSEFADIMNEMARQVETGEKELNQ